MNIINVDCLPEKKDKKAVIKSLFNNWILDVTFEYKSDYKKTKELRDFINIICELLELSDKEKSRLILISDELNNNAIEYWSSKNWTNYMRVKAYKHDDYIDFNLEVEDNWKWKKHKTALEMETMRAHKLKLWYFNHDSIRWRWLFLITVKIVDRLYFRNAANWWLIVWIKTKLKKKKAEI